MAVRATFTGFDPYKLTGVTVTDRELGRGSYATLLELEYIGLKCAGKKIHKLLLRQGDASYTVRRFAEECRLLSQVRHPNIVQFLGVYFQQGMQAPILVMEFLPTNLTSCIERYGILPKEISYSILHGVALGLCYLHSQIPPIVHRDLSSNNVLLTPNMTAKISDLGVAKILNLTPLQVSHMTQTPGTPAYMPPEVMVANPKYDTSVDEFSYGIMMIHIFSGQWPEPQVGPSRIEGGKLIPVTEAERRDVFFKVIEYNHPLKDLTHRCINNDPQLRPHASEIVRQVSQIASQCPASFANRLEMLRQIDVIKEEKRALTEEGERKDRVIQTKKHELLISGKVVQALTEEGERKDRIIRQKKDEFLISRKVVQVLTEEGERKNRIIQQKNDELLISRKEVQALTEEGERKDNIIQQKNDELIVNRKEVQALTEEGERKDRVIQQKNDEILTSKKEIQTLTEEGERKNKIIKQKESQISICREEIRTKLEQKAAEIDQLKLTHSAEVGHLQLQIRDLKTQNKVLKAENEAEITELKSKITALEVQTENSAKTLLQEREQSTRQLYKEREQHEIQSRQEKQEFEAQLVKEREANRKLATDLVKSKSEMTILQYAKSKLQSDIMTTNTIIQLKDAAIKRKDSDLEAKSRALEEKDATISAMSEQLTKAREYLATKQQAIQASITWKQCASLPIRLSNGNTTIINGKIYCGGGDTVNGDEYIVNCFDPSQNKWTTLPPLPVQRFGLGQVYGKLVAVGGVNKDATATNEVYKYNERSRKWKRVIPPMPTARFYPGVLSLKSALVVAGGDTDICDYTDVVEIFKLDKSQWYRTDALPTACVSISLDAIGNTCYALGGYNGSSLNQAIYASVDDLFGNAVPANQPNNSGSSGTQSAWKTLSNTPTYRPTAAMLAGKLLAVGGRKTSDGLAAMKEVYMYSPSTNSWIYISDLPALRALTAIAVLVPADILVIGGYDGTYVNTVYRGTLALS